MAVGMCYGCSRNADGQHVLFIDVGETKTAMYLISIVGKRGIIRNVRYLYDVCVKYIDNIIVQYIAK